MTKDYDVYIFCHKNMAGPVCFYDKVGTGFRVHMYTHMFGDSKKPKLPAVLKSKFKGHWVKVKDNSHLIEILG